MACSNKMCKIYYEEGLTEPKRFLININCQGDNEKDEYQAFFASALKHLEGDAFFSEKCAKRHPVFEFKDEENCFWELSSTSSGLLPATTFRLSFGMAKSNSAEDNRETQDETPNVQIVSTVDDKESSLLEEVNLEDAEVEVAEAMLSPKKKKGKRSATTKKPRFTLASVSLPNFSERVQTIISKNQLREDTVQFVRECVDHLLSFCPYPSTVEYNIFCTKVVATYPELAVRNEYGGPAHFLFKKCLLDRVHNKRSRDKAAARPSKSKKGSVARAEELLEPIGSTIAISTDSNQSPASFQSIAETPSVVNMDDATEDQLALVMNIEKLVDDEFGGAEIHSEEELNCALKNSNLSVSSILPYLSQYSATRRAWIKMCPSIKTILEEYPCYGNPLLIIYEFYDIVERDENELQAKFDKMISKLAERYGIVVDSEEEKLLCIVAAEKELHSKAPKLATKAFSVLQDVTSENLPHMTSAVAPTLQAYAANGQIKQAFLLAEMKVVAELKETTAYLAFCLTYGSYYAFHREYQENYHRVMKFFDLAILGQKVDAGGNRTFKRFLESFQSP